MENYLSRIDYYRVQTSVYNRSERVFINSFRLIRFVLGSYFYYCARNGRRRFYFVFFSFRSRPAMSARYRIIVLQFSSIFRRLYLLEIGAHRIIRTWPVSR